MESLSLLPNQFWDTNQKQLCKKTCQKTKEIHQKIKSLVQEFIFCPRISQKMPEVVKQMEEIYGLKFEIKPTEIDWLKELMPYLKGKKVIDRKELVAQNIYEAGQKLESIFRSGKNFSFSEYYVLRDFFSSLVAFIEKNKEFSLESDFFSIIMKNNETNSSRKELTLFSLSLKIKEIIDSLDLATFLFFQRRMEKYTSFFNKIEVNIFNLNSRLILICSYEHITTCTSNCEQEAITETKEKLSENFQEFQEINEKIKKIKTKEEKYQVSCEILQKYGSTVSLPSYVRSLKRMIKYTKEVPQVYKFILVEQIKELSILRLRELGSRF